MPKTNTTKNSLLNNLHEAMRALRVNLLRTDLHPVIRAHIERAIDHTESAYGAVALADQKAREAKRSVIYNKEMERLDGLIKKVEGK